MFRVLSDEEFNLSQYLLYPWLLRQTTSVRLSWCDRLSEDCLDILHPATLDKFLDNILLVMLIESGFGSITLKEVEYGGVVLVPR